MGMGGGQQDQRGGGKDGFPYRAEGVATRRHQLANAVVHIGGSHAGIAAGAVDRRIAGGCTGKVEYIGHSVAPGMKKARRNEPLLLL